MAKQIPAEVEKTPAGPGGNGFILEGYVSDTMVGPDERYYTRVNGVVSLEVPDEEDEGSSGEQD